MRIVSEDSNVKQNKGKKEALRFQRWREKRIGK